MEENMDLIGKKFERITIVKFVERKNYKDYYICKCDCGNTKKIDIYSILSGRTKSCGCLKMERAKEYHRKDLTGERFGRLVVLEIGENIGDDTTWICKCDCGNKKQVLTRCLTHGMTKSCGCLKMETAIGNLTKKIDESHKYIINGKIKYGKSYSRLYKTWQGMKERCYNVNNSNYDNYGGRGIKVYDKWRDSFLTFEKWSLENGYTDELTLDRIDVNGNYEPCNCR